MADPISLISLAVGVGSTVFTIITYIVGSGGGVKAPPVPSGQNPVPNSVLVQMGSPLGGSVMIHCNDPQGGAAGSNVNNIPYINAGTVGTSILNGGSGVGRQANNCTIQPWNSGHNSPYDSICVSGILVTLGNGIVFGWDGDTAAGCGNFNVAPGGVAFDSGSGSNGSLHYPSCVYLAPEANFGNLQLNINLPTYNTRSNSDLSQEKICGSASQTILFPTVCFDDSPPFSYQPPGAGLAFPTNCVRTGSRPQKRQTIDGRSAAAAGPYQDKNETRFIMSSIKPGGINSAKNLCGMSNSWGPDYWHPEEGYWCDMSERKLNKICPPPSQKACFDDCWRWDGNVTGTYWQKGRVTKITRIYTQMLRHPMPLAKSDPSMPGACGTY